MCYLCILFFTSVHYNVLLYVSDVRKIVFVLYLDIHICVGKARGICFLLANLLGNIFVLVRTWVFILYLGIDICFGG